jgi:hypothetical protein
MPRSILRRQSLGITKGPKKTLSFSEERFECLFERHSPDGALASEEEEEAPPPDFTPLAFLDQDVELAWNTVCNHLNGMDPGTSLPLPPKIQQAGTGPARQAYVAMRSTARRRDVLMWHKYALEPYLRRRCRALVPMTESNPLEAEKQIRALDEWTLQQRRLLESSGLSAYVRVVNKYRDGIYALFCKAKLNGNPAKFEALRGSAESFKPWWER